MFARRFHLITGKGGVGKSSVSAALSLYFAQQGHRTLLCEMDPREQMSALFGVEASAGVLRPLNEDLPLWGVNVELRQALREYGQLKLRFKTLAQLFFENPLTDALVNLLPGVQELIMLGKAFHHEREQIRGVPRWDRIVVDAPATGHGLALLSLPQVIRDSVSQGNLHREAAEMWQLITDPNRAAIHVVTLPEQIPLYEAKALWHTLSNQLKVAIGALILNQVPITQTFPTSPEHAALLKALMAQPLSPPASQAIESIVHLYEKHQQRQQRCLKAIENETLPAPPLTLPLLLSPSPAALAQALDASINALSSPLTLTALLDGSVAPLAKDVP